MSTEALLWLAAAAVGGALLVLLLVGWRRRRREGASAARIERLVAAGELVAAARLAAEGGRLDVAFDLYVRANDHANAAGIAVKRGDLRRAASLYEQIGNVGRAVALYDQVGLHRHAEMLRQTKLSDPALAVPAGPVSGTYPVPPVSGVHAVPRVPTDPAREVSGAHAVPRVPTEPARLVSATHDVPPVPAQRAGSVSGTHDVPPAAEESPRAVSGPHAIPPVAEPARVSGAYDALTIAAEPVREVSGPHDVPPRASDPALAVGGDLERAALALVDEARASATPESFVERIAELSPSVAMRFLEQELGTRPLSVATAEWHYQKAKLVDRGGDARRAVILYLELQDAIGSYRDVDVRLAELTRALQPPSVTSRTRRVTRAPIEVTLEPAAAPPAVAPVELPPASTPVIELPPASTPVIELPQPAVALPAPADVLPPPAPRAAASAPPAATVSAPPAPPLIAPPAPVIAPAAPVSAPPAATVTAASRAAGSSPPPYRPAVVIPPQPSPPAVTRKPTPTPAGTPMGNERYELRGELGRGRLAAVYRAFDRTLGREVALKALSEELSSRDLVRERFLAQNRAAGALGHPNLVAVHDTGMLGGRAYIAMELVDGPSLDVLRREPGALSIVESLRIVKQVLDGLAWLHGGGILHLDLRPANILRDAAGQVKLMDAGIAIPRGEGQPPAVLGAVAAYQAPELVRGGAADVDARADIFAAAVTLFELLAHQLPYGPDRDAPPARLAELAPAVPGQLEAAIMKGLSLDRDQRWRSAAELSARLGAILDAVNAYVAGRRRRTAGPPI